MLVEGNMEDSPEMRLVQDTGEEQSGHLRVWTVAEPWEASSWEGKRGQTQGSVTAQLYLGKTSPQSSLEDD